jgi:hypothetical protein
LCPSPADVVTFPRLQGYCSRSGCPPMHRGCPCAA